MFEIPKIPNKITTELFKANPGAEGEAVIRELLTENGNCMKESYKRDLKDYAEDVKLAIASKRMTREEARSIQPYNLGLVTKCFGFNNDYTIRAAFGKNDCLASSTVVPIAYYYGVSPHTLLTGDELPITIPNYIEVALNGYISLPNKLEENEPAEKEFLDRYESVGIPEDMVEKKKRDALYMAFPDRERISEVLDRRVVNNTFAFYSPRLSDYVTNCSRMHYLAGSRLQSCLKDRGAAAAKLLDSELSRPFRRLVIKYEETGKIQFVSVPMALLALSLGISLDFLILNDYTRFSKLKRQDGRFLTDEETKFVSRFLRSGEDKDVWFSCVLNG